MHVHDFPSLFSSILFLYDTAASLSGLVSRIIISPTDSRNRMAAGTCRRSSSFSSFVFLLLLVLVSYPFTACPLKLDDSVTTSSTPSFPSSSQSPTTSTASQRPLLHALVSSLESSITPDSKAPSFSTCAFSGRVGDCNCSFSAVRRLNHLTLHPLLVQLTRRRALRYFRVRLHCTCPFEDISDRKGSCGSRYCEVCGCDANDVPAAPWYVRSTGEHDAADKSCYNFEDDSYENGTGSGDGAEGFADDDDGRSGHHGGGRAEMNVIDLGWDAVEDNPWTHEDESDAGLFQADAQYVDLVANPERYTGYKGDEAHRVWAEVYGQNCFVEEAMRHYHHGGGQCTEERVLYRLMSGMHASISAHIAYHHPLNDGSDEWGPNLDVFAERFSGHPSRVENLYFAFLFVLRAAMRSRWQLLSTTFDTGDAEDDAETTRLVRLALGGDSGVYDACPLPFDEGRMWQGDESAMRREQLMNNLRNVSSIMDCVGCEKCRLWGKLQVLGIASSMKVLSATEGEPAPVLARNEIVALVNSLARFSEAIRTVAEMDDALAKRETERQLETDEDANGSAEVEVEEEEQGVGDIETGSVDEL